MMLNQSQLEQFRTNGYLVVPDIVPEVLRSRVIEAILEFSNIDLADPSTWYHPSFTGHGIVPLHHDQALWDIRQHPALYEVFRDLYDEHELWVSMDRVSYKPPSSAKTSAWQRSPVHWDCNPWQLHDLSLQGLVYLTDTDEDQGPLLLVPAIYRDLENHLKKTENSDQRRNPQVGDEQLMPVTGQAGSLIIWNRLMPHTSRINASQEHRFVQYITMEPATTESMRLQRIKKWRDKMPPDWAIKQKIKHQQIPEPGDKAMLTRLGRQLVGVDKW